jgi:hypothetical protein
VALSGCGEQEKRLPVACDTDSAAVTEALKRAPGEVTLDGVRLSDCFTRAADPAEIQQVGSTFIATADALAERVRSAPRSSAATQLGYLVGAVHKGASGTQGIHYETERRIEAALVGIDTRTPQYRRGFEAGERSG